MRTKKQSLNLFYSPKLKMITKLFSTKFLFISFFSLFCTRKIKKSREDMRILP